MAGPFQPDPTANPDPTAAPPPAPVTLDPWNLPPAPPTPVEPVYGTPQYPAPVQPAASPGSAPPYTAPPSSGAPQYPAPQYPAPQYPEPQYPAPQYPAPQSPPAQYPSQYPAPPAAQYPPAPPATQFPLPPPPPPPPAGGPFSTTPYQAPKGAPRGGTKAAQIGGAVVVAIVIAIIRIAVHVNNDNSDPPRTVDTPAKVTFANAFDKTPAALYAKGEAGIMLPTATAVPGFTADQVAADLKTVRNAMIAARLDPTMLTTHDPKTLLALLAPADRADIQKDFDSKQFVWYATQIGANEHLSTESVRVKGTFTVKGSTSTGGVKLLDVTSNFVWVYAFDGPITRAGDHLVTVHDEVTWTFPAADAGLAADELGLYIDEAKAYLYNMDCDLLDKSQVGLGSPKYSSSGTSQDDGKSAFDPASSIDTARDDC